MTKHHLPPTAFVELSAVNPGFRQWVVLCCPYCAKRHAHGAGSITQDPYTFLGHRAAHCVDGDNVGYVLDVKP